MEERALTQEEQQEFAEMSFEFKKASDQLQNLSLDDLRRLGVAIIPVPKKKNLEDRNGAAYERIQPNTICFVGVSNRSDDFASLLLRCEATAIAIDNNGHEYLRLQQRTKFNNRKQRDMLRGYVTMEKYGQMAKMIETHTVDKPKG